MKFVINFAKSYNCHLYKMLREHGKVNNLTVSVNGRKLCEKNKAFFRFYFHRFIFLLLFLLVATFHMQLLTFNQMTRLPWLSCQPHGLLGVILPLIYSMSLLILFLFVQQTNDTRYIYANSFQSQLCSQIIFSAFFVQFFRFLNISKQSMAVPPGLC